MKTTHQLPLVIPNLYYQYGPNFVELLEQYYTWMDQQFADVERLRNVESTEQRFLEKFLDEYGPDIHRNGYTNDVLLAQHITELYRSKGTPRSIDLFFRLVYGTGAEVSFPRENTFTTSGSVYRKPQYIEVTPSPLFHQLLHKQVLFSSGGSAFVENTREVRGKNTTHYLLTISDPVGTISLDATVYTNTSTKELCPRVVGSLSSVRVVESDDGFELGLPVEFESTNGTQATGFITGINQYGQEVQFAILNGGSGYSATPSIYVSDQIITLGNVATSAGTRYPFQANVVQILYEAVVDNSLDIPSGSTVNAIGNSSVVSATVITSEQTTGVGRRFILQSSGPLANIVASKSIAASTGNANAVFASVNAVAKLVGQTASTRLFIQSAQTAILTGQTVYQYSGTSLVAQGQVTSVPSTGVLDVQLTTGNFSASAGLKLTANSSAVNAAVVTSVSEYVGIANVVGQFYANAFTTIANTTGIPSDVSTGQSARVEVGSLECVANVLLVNTTDNTIANTEQLSMSGSVYTKASLGSIATLTVSNPGANYSLPPVVVIRQTASSGANGVKTLTVDSTENFIGGDTITQTGIVDNTRRLTVPSVDGFRVGDFIYRGTTSSPTAVGIVSKIDRENNWLFVGSVYGTFVTSSTVRALSSSANAVPSSVVNSADVVTAIGKIIDKTPTSLTVLSGPDLPSNRFAVGGVVKGSLGGTATISAITSSGVVAGNNAVVTSSLKIIDDSIATVSVENSGFGFLSTEEVNIISNGQIVGSGVASVSSVGIEQGFFENTKSFTSKDQYLFDGIRYQPYSYEIKTSADPSNNEADTAFLQIAGMQMLIHTEISDRAGVTEIQEAGEILLANI